MTAEILRGALAFEGEVVTFDALAPGGSIRAIVRRLAESRQDDEIFLVGHEPDLGRLAGTLLFGTPDAPLPLKKAGVCAVDLDGPVGAGAGHLVWFLPPRFLRRLAGRKQRLSHA